MSTTLEDLKRRAATLSEVERADLALALIESLEDSADSGDVHLAWSLEIERRAAEVERGVVQPVNGDAVLARLRRRLG